MIRILIVDDEPYIVEGMVGLLEEAELPETEIRGAISSGEALEWMARTKVDIVLSDIHMPGMNGLELQKRILQQWPRCKVVFLTGHNEFEYAKEALRYGASDYILKTDGDEAILDTIRRTMDQVKEQSVRESFLESAQAQMRSALPLLQKEYIQELLRSPATSRTVLADQLTRLQIPLSADAEVLAVQGRILNWPEQMNSSDRTLMTYAIRNIANEYWEPGAELISLGIEQERMVWLLQIKPSATGDNGDNEAAWRRLQSFAFGNLESIQATCRELLRLSVSFVMGAKETAWEKLPEQMEALNLTFRRSFGMGDDLLLRESAEPEQNMQILKGLSVRDSSLKSAALAALLEGGKQQLFERTLHEYMLDPALVNGPETGRIAAYYQLVVILMSDLSSGNLFQIVNERMELSRLYKYDAHDTWEDRLDYLTKLADAIFEHHRTRLQRHNDELIAKLKDYIDSHISDDLSLTRLGEVASFNASYLSRIFKQYSGMNLTEYIMQVRMNEATRLLRESNMQVQEITKAIGLESAAYFIRMFKRATHMTPQQYREFNQ